MIKAPDGYVLVEQFTNLEGEKVVLIREKFPKVVMVTLFMFVLNIALIISDKF